MSSTNYYKSHKDILNGFLIQPARLTGTLYWGMKEDEPSVNEFVNTFPKDDDQFKQQIRLTKGIKLERINYKVYDIKYKLCAIQLCFSNGMITPLFEDPAYVNKGYELQTVEVDKAETIRSISIKIGNGKLKSDYYYN